MPRVGPRRAHRRRRSHIERVRPAARVRRTHPHPAGRTATPPQTTPTGGIVTLEERVLSLYAERARPMARFEVPEPERPSRAVSARYRKACPRCEAEPGQPCRTLKTDRITNAHVVRIE